MDPYQTNKENTTCSNDCHGPHLINNRITIEVCLDRLEHGIVELLEVGDLQEASQLHNGDEMIPPVPVLQIFS